MKFFNFSLNSILFFVGAFILYFTASAQPLSQEELLNMPIYTSLESALKEPEKVYRLQLKGSFKMDSLPDAIFEFSNLQELTVKRCRLLILNSRIKQLQHLQYLNLDHNRLVSLPEELCLLPALKILVISRNMIHSLPENIGKMQVLTEIVAWENPLYVLPESITALSETLKIIDLRQIGFKRTEIEKIEKQLPKTNILYTNLCDCKNNRE